MSVVIARASAKFPSGYRRIMRSAAVAGAAGMTCCVISAVVTLFLAKNPDFAIAFFKAYLTAWLFWLGVALGAMSAVMVHHLTGGEWGYLVRRFGEAAAGTLPLLMVLFVPMFLGLRRVYPWADPSNHDPIVAHRRPWMSSGLVTARYLIYFAIWIAIARFLRRLSMQLDRAPNVQIVRRLRAVSAVGLLAYFITMSLASVDWIMSLEPQWYSTVFGFIVCMSQTVIGICFLIIMLEVLSVVPPFVERLRPRHFNDLATLLVTAVILWAYNSFSQLLIIWMGNIQGEITWYVKRNAGMWHLLSILLVFVGFLAPFVLLLQRSVKKRGRVLMWVCLGLLVMQFLDILWMVAPSGNEPYPSMNWLSPIMACMALIGVGGFWLAVFLRLLDQAPLMPLGEHVPIEVAIAKPFSKQRSIDHGAEGGTEPGIV